MNNVQQNTRKKVLAIVEPILAEMGFEAVDVEVTSERGKFILRLLIEREEREITINDCVDVSRRLEDQLEVERVMSGPYCFEVASPGVDRPLTRNKDFFANLGQELKVLTWEPINQERRKKIIGRLIGFDPKEKVITMFYDKKQVQIHLDQIKKARIKI